MLKRLFSKISDWFFEATFLLRVISLYNVFLTFGMYAGGLASGNFSLKTGIFSFLAAIMMAILFSIAPLAFYAHRYDARWTNNPSVESRASLELTEKIGGFVAHVLGAVPAIFFTIKIIREI